MNVAKGIQFRVIHDVTTMQSSGFNHLQVNTRQLEHSEVFLWDFRLKDEPQQQPCRSHPQLYILDRAISDKFSQRDEPN